MGSGSSGNCYILTDSSGKNLILDAGVKFIEVKKALGFNISNILGVLVTHGHLDHNGYSMEYEVSGIPVIRSYESESLLDTVKLGQFKIKSFPCVHSCPCVGYLIEHEEMGRMIYATDTQYVRFRFRNLRTILIEMNYSNEYIDRRAAKFAHVVQGHMEKQTTLDFLKANAGPELRHVILCHLSSDGADPVEFRESVRKIVPSDVTVDIAVPGGEVDLREIPF